MTIWMLSIIIPNDVRAESFGDDLNMERGIISGRVALLLQSIEIQLHHLNDLLVLSFNQTLGCPSSTTFQYLKKKIFKDSTSNCLFPPLTIL